jgi:hypothetical protein
MIYAPLGVILRIDFVDTFRFVPDCFLLRFSQPQ